MLVLMYNFSIHVSRKTKQGANSYYHQVVIIWPLTSGMAISSSKIVAWSSAITVDKFDTHNYVHEQNRTCISAATLDKVSQQSAPIARRQGATARSKWPAKKWYHRMKWNANSKGIKATARTCMHDVSASLPGLGTTLVPDRLGRATWPPQPHIIMI